MRTRPLVALCIALSATAAFAQDAAPPTQPGQGPGAVAPGARGMRQRQPRVNGEVIAVTADSITVKSIQRPMNFQRNRLPGTPGTAATPGTPGTTGAVTQPGTPAAPRTPAAPVTQIVKMNAQTTFVNMQRQPVAKSEVKVGANVMVQYTTDAAGTLTAQTVTVLPPTARGTLVAINAKTVTVRDAAGKYLVFNILPTTVMSKDGNVVTKATDLPLKAETIVQYQGTNALRVYQGIQPRGMGGFGGMRNAPGANRQPGANAGAGRRGGRGGAGAGNTIAPPIDAGE